MDVEFHLGYGSILPIFRYFLLRQFQRPDGGVELENAKWQIESPYLFDYGVLVWVSFFTYSHQSNCIVINIQKLCLLSIIQDIYLLSIFDPILFLFHQFQFFSFPSHTT